MGDIALSDYLAYVFQEISKARTMADHYTKEVAAAYASDDVLRHFPVPRFKIAKLDLTLPVFVSAVQINPVANLEITEQELKQAMTAAVASVVNAPTPGIIAKAIPIPVDVDDASIAVIHKKLNTSNERPEVAVKAHLTGLVMEVFKKNGIKKDLSKGPSSEILDAKAVELADVIRKKLTITKGTVNGLLVNPETNVVKTGGATAPLLTIRAELLEEGLFVKSVRDEATGKETSIVEFD